MPGVQQSDKSMDIGMLFKQRPVEPVVLIIKTVSVVITLLSPAHLVAHQDHWHTERQHVNGQEIFNLAIAKLLYGWIVRWTFDATVPAAIIVVAVAIPFKVCFVVFLFV